MPVQRALADAGLLRDLRDGERPRLRVRRIAGKGRTVGSKSRPNINVPKRRSTGVFGNTVAMVYIHLNTARNSHLANRKTVFIRCSFLDALAVFGHRGPALGQGYALVG